MAKNDFGKGSKKRRDAALKAAKTRKENIKKKKSSMIDKKKKITKKTNSLSPGKKAALTRADHYDRASAEEKARIDESRHQAAIKAAQTKKQNKGIKPIDRPKPIRKIDWSIAVEKAENTGKAAMEITKWRINQLASRTKWQILEFMGKKGKESAGIVDLLAIRKDHERIPKKTGLKPGDLFEIILLQVKGGNANWPSRQDITRLQNLGRYYYARDIVLSEWKDYQLSFYRLKRNIDTKERFDPRTVWVKASPSELFP